MRPPEASLALLLLAGCLVLGACSRLTFVKPSTDRGDYDQVAPDYNVSEDPRDAMHASMELQRAMSAMERLPDEQREVVALILIEGFGYREVSEMLDLPIGTVSSRLVRGRIALLEMLGGNADG